MVFTEGLLPRLIVPPRDPALEPVSLNRKNSFSLSLTTWSNRTLVESSELLFVQLAIYCAVLSDGLSIPPGVGKGKAFKTGWSTGSAVCRTVLSGTRTLLAGGC